MVVRCVADLGRLEGERGLAKGYVTVRERERATCELVRGGEWRERERGGSVGCDSASGCSFATALRPWPGAFPCRGRSGWQHLICMECRMYGMHRDLANWLQVRFLIATSLSCAGTGLGPGGGPSIVKAFTMTD